MTAMAVIGPANCGGCQYYKMPYCRRYPPSAARSQWPTVNDDQWCGEHKPRRALQCSAQFPPRPVLEGAKK